MEHPPVPSKTWDLSLYELHRTPQEAITDNTEIAVSPRSLHSELMCPICLDMLKNTMTTKECLHRFCNECIITALRSGNKECPTCRKKLVSKRSLRPDPNFDNLISKIYPSRDEYEAHQERVLAKLKETVNVFNQSVQEGLRLQALNRHRATSKKHSLHDDDVSASSTDNTPQKKRPRLANDESTAAAGDAAIDQHVAMSSSSAAAAAQPTMNEIELIFKPHPREKKDQKAKPRYLKTTGNAKGD